MDNTAPSPLMANSKVCLSVHVCLEDKKKEGFVASVEYGHKGEHGPESVRCH